MFSLFFTYTILALRGTHAVINKEINTRGESKEGRLRNLRN